MSTYKNSRKNIEWNKWKRKNKEATIIKEIDKLAPPEVDSRMLDITKSQNNRNPELNDIQLRRTRKSTRNDKKNSASRRHRI